jgi:hypothetical protein
VTDTQTTSSIADAVAALESRAEAAEDRCAELTDALTKAWHLIGTALSTDVRLARAGDSADGIVAPAVPSVPQPPTTPRRSAEEWAKLEAAVLDVLRVHPTGIRVGEIARWAAMEGRMVSQTLARLAKRGDVDVRPSTPQGYWRLHGPAEAVASANGQETPTPARPPIENFGQHDESLAGLD